MLHVFEVTQTRADVQYGSLIPMNQMLESIEMQQLPIVCCGLVRYIVHTPIGIQKHMNSAILNSVGYSH